MEYNILHTDHHTTDINNSNTKSNNHYDNDDNNDNDNDDIKEKEQDDRKSFFNKFTAMACGNALEYYDFAIFGSLIDIIAENFFPSSHTHDFAFLLSLAIYGSAFVMRPVGGVVIGYIGDKFTRKKALEISICLMIIPSFMMGCLPTFHQWGWAMTLLLILCRLTQGLAVGGELIGAFIITLESSYSKNDPGFWGALCKSSCFSGSAMGMGIVAVLRLVLTHDQMLSFGWRIPFFVGIIFGVIGLHFRLKLKEESEDIANDESSVLTFNSIDIPEEKQQSPCYSLLVENSTNILLVIIVTSFWGSSFYTCCVWITYYLSDSSLIGEKDCIGAKAFFVSFVITLVLVLIFPIGGLLADRYGRHLNDRMEGIRYTMMIATVLMISLALPAMYLISNQHLIGTICGLIMFITSITLFGACLPSFMISRFPKNVRYLACGLSYNISNAIFAGGSPMIATFLVHSSQRKTSSTIIATLLNDSAYRPCYYLMSISVIVLFSLAMIPRLDKSA